MSKLELNLELWPRQLQAFESEATEILFGGATEGGKSHYARVALIAWCLSIPGLQCVLVRKKYDDILKNHVEGPTGFRSLLAPLLTSNMVSITQKEIRFTNGSIISFQHCQDERQFDSAQGVEKHVLVIDEATQISERIIRFFRGWVRMPQEMRARLPKQLQGKFPRIIYTANPIGVSVSFFKREFVKARPAFAIDEVDGFKRQYIPSRATDNPSVDMAAHTGRLAGIGDAALAKALDEGDWDTPIGEFFPEWDERKHVVENFLPPTHWFRFRSFDWGTAEPFAVYWWAVSDGESFEDYRGRRRWFPRGALIAYREWYGCDTLKPAEGIRMRNEDMAYGILERSEPEHRTCITLTDSLPFQDRGGLTIAETFANCGVILSRGDTSREAGWSQLRSRLIGTYLDSNDSYRTPMIYFVEDCVYARDYMPSLARHKSKPEDAVESGEATHTCDAIRIASMAFHKIKDLDPPEPTTDNLSNANMTFDDVVVKIRKSKVNYANLY